MVNHSFQHGKTEYKVMGDFVSERCTMYAMMTVSLIQLTFSDFFHSINFWKHSLYLSREFFGNICSMPFSANFKIAAGNCSSILARKIVFQKMILHAKATQNWTDTVVATLTRAPFEFDLSINGFVHFDFRLLAWVLLYFQ